MRSSPSSVAACCRCCFTDIRATIVEVIASHKSPAIACIWTRAASSCFALVPKQYGRAGGLNVSSPYQVCRPLILMTTSTELGPGMSCKCLASALVVCQSFVSLLLALFKFFFDGSTDLSIVSKPRPGNSGLEISYSSLSSSEGSFSSVGWPPSSADSCSLPPSSPQPHCLPTLTAGSSRCQSISLPSLSGCLLIWAVVGDYLALEIWPQLPVAS